jgi:hypothetical protein
MKTSRWFIWDSTIQDMWIVDLDLELDTVEITTCVGEQFFKEMK